MTERQGRELDAWLMEHVMDTPVVCHDWPCGYDCECGDYYAAWRRDAGGNYSENGPVYVPVGGHWPPDDDGNVMVEPVPFFSTDDEAAIRLLDAMRGLPKGEDKINQWRWMLESRCGGRVDCRFWRFVRDSMERHEATDNTLAAAISRAAERALEGDDRP